jgi:hypothetical protein
MPADIQKIITALRRGYVNAADMDKLERFIRGIYEPLAQAGN